jgi:hypothetical protein
MVCGNSLEFLPWNNVQPARKNPGIFSRVFQQAWKKYRPNTPCNLENHGKTWIFFHGFPDYMLAGKPWKKIHVFPWFSRLHGVFGRYFFHACWKTLEYFPGFSTFNIPWMPGITWKIVQLIPWSLERKKKSWSTKQNTCMQIFWSII